MKDSVEWITVQEAVDRGICISCRMEVKPHPDYVTTGLCIRCLTDIFGDEEEDNEED